MQSAQLQIGGSNSSKPQTAYKKFDIAIVTSPIGFGQSLKPQCQHFSLHGFSFSEAGVTIFGQEDKFSANTGVTELQLQSYMQLLCCVSDKRKTNQSKYGSLTFESLFIHSLLQVIQLKNERVNMCRDTKLSWDRLTVSFKLLSSTLSSSYVIQLSKISYFVFYSFAQTQYSK